MTTLSQLKTSVDNWLARDDIAVSNTDFTQMLLIAEAQIAREVHCAIQETSTTLNFTGRSANLPADFLRARTPFVDDNTRKTEYMTPEVIRESSAWNDGRVGSFYTVEGDMASAVMKVVIAGPASVASPLSMDVYYYARFPALVNGADTNWLLANHYDVYLYACLRAAGEYLQEDVLEDRYATKFNVSAESLNRHELRKKFNGAAKQSYGSPRTVV